MAPAEKQSADDVEEINYGAWYRKSLAYLTLTFFIRFANENANSVWPGAPSVSEPDCDDGFNAASSAVQTRSDERTTKMRNCPGGTRECPGVQRSIGRWTGSLG